MEHRQTFFKKAAEYIPVGGCQCVYTFYYSNYGKQVQ